MREVYFIEGAGLIKIGSSTSAIRRFSNMLTGSPIPLSLLASIPGGVEIELHRRFASQRSHGEWFRPCLDLTAVIAAAPVQYGEDYRNVLSYLPGRTVQRPSATAANVQKAEWKTLPWQQRMANLFS